MPISSAPFFDRRSFVALRQPGRDAVKRAIDLVASGLLIVALAPLLVAIWIIVRATSRGPAAFVQQRVGRDGRLFAAYKFRTMVIDAEARLAEHLRDDPVARAEFATFRKLHRDPRVTPVGNFLRRYSLDELPQILNILKGDMSLVGPRCYLPQELPEMGLRQSVILSVTPGLTGLWQVSGRSGTTFAQRLEIDMRYVRGRSLALDLRILAQTVLVVLTARGAC
jgi:lipopolysaccharide/colanic/teichoic acid biosynthesis glycosyltransferase